MFSSSIVSGGGLMLLSSNSATTLGGRRDLGKLRGAIRTSAIVDLRCFDLGNAVSTSLLASIVLPRFEIQIATAIFISSNRFPERISIVCAFNYFLSNFVSVNFFSI